MAKSDKAEQKPARAATEGEVYHTGHRVWGGSFVSRLNPDIVSSHINADIGAKHLPFPLVVKTDRTVPEQDRNRHDRIMIPNNRFPK